MNGGMTKTLAVILLAPFEQDSCLTFRMDVPVNVFPMGTLIIRPAPGTNDPPILLRHVKFDAGTDGVVDVIGETTSHDLQGAQHFLERHPDVAVVSLVSKT